MARFSYSTLQQQRKNATGGNFLIFTTLLALIVANIPQIKDVYFNFWNIPITVQWGDFSLFSAGGHAMTMMQFINDVLMAVFFFSIGLEIKREILVGELTSFRKALLPIVAACGGMIVPVILFCILGKDTDYLGGAAIPMATDIAFSLGVLSLLGKRVPVALKVFLTTLAVVDDIGGIIVIAVFYTSKINVWYLVYSLVPLALLLYGNKLRFQSKMYYVTLGMVVWYFFLNAGIHPTIAGVIVAFCIPATPVMPPRKYIASIRANISHFPAEEDQNLDDCTLLSKEQLNWLKKIESMSDKMISPLQDLEDTLHPIVNWVILPLFAFANAGICFSGMSFSAITSGVGLAIIIGLVLGKFLGIFLFSWATIKLKFAPMPFHCNWKMLASVAMLGGIGFTVSLFIANLSFGSMGAEGAELLNDAKLGIIVGSLISGILGYSSLASVLSKENLHEEDDDDNDNDCDDNDN